MTQTSERFDLLSDCFLFFNNHFNQYNLLFHYAEVSVQNKLLLFSSLQKYRLQTVNLLPVITMK